MEDDTPRLDRFLRRLPSLWSCCYIIDIYTGTIIVGCVGLVSSVVFLVIDIVYISIFIDLLPTDNAVVTNIRDMKHLEGILVYDSIVQLATSFSYAFLIPGRTRKKPRKVRLFLACSMFLILAKAISCIVFLSFMKIYIFLLSWGYVGAMVYYFLVVNTHYLGLDDGGRHY